MTWRNATLARATAAWLTGLLGATSAAAAAGPAALIEEVRGVAGLRVFDYVESGRQIDLGTGGALILGYLKTCLRETITGGQVTVGIDQSTVLNGKTIRERVECDGGNLRLTADQSGKSGATVFRTIPNSGTMLRVFALSPAIGLGPHGATASPLVIERTDRGAPAITVPRSAGERFVDLAGHGVKLVRGGQYEAVIGSDRVPFRIDPLAADGVAPLLSRLVAF